MMPYWRASLNLPSNMAGKAKRQIMLWCSCCIEICRQGHFVFINVIIPVAPVKLSSAMSSVLSYKMTPSTASSSNKTPSTLCHYPIPIGYHRQQQQVDSAKLMPCQSRPMSPGEQFQKIKVRQDWEEATGGEPTKTDLEVYTIKFVCIYYVDRNPTLCCGMLSGWNDLFGA